MIPKIIHYCWFSTDSYPPLIRKCIRSWRKKLPEYQLVLWNSNNFDFNSVPFVKRCIELRKWAFAADYIRLYAIYNYGGIYLDSDVMVLKTFEQVLHCNAFWGIDYNEDHNYAFPEAAIFGAVKSFYPLKQMMDYYESFPVEKLNDESFRNVKNLFQIQNRTIFNDEGTLQLVTAPVVMESVLTQYGFIQKNINQHLSENINIWGHPVFLNGINRDTVQTIAHHQNAASWFYTNRGPIFSFFHNHPQLMPLYSFVERHSH